MGICHAACKEYVIVKVNVLVNFNLGYTGFRATGDSRQLPGSLSLLQNGNVLQDGLGAHIQYLGK